MPDMMYFSVVLLDQNVEHDERDMPMTGRDEESTGSFQRFPESSSRTSLGASTSRTVPNNFSRKSYDNSSDDSSFSSSPPPMSFEGRKRKIAPGLSRRSSYHRAHVDELYSSSPRTLSPDAMDTGSSATESERSMSASPPPPNESSASFTKVVMTKFSHPPGYRAKKVKFHTCTECGKAFPRPSGLRTHMNTHTKAKPYPCTFEGCDKTFSVISNAKRHFRTHLTGPAPDPFGTSGPFIVDFSEPVVLDAIPPSSAFDSEDGGVGRASPSTSISSSESVSPPGLQPVSLKWLPPGSDTRRSLYTPVCQKGASRSI
ncbi:hypothetical protein BKA70DRAFT_1345029 [Coprinopsis sp. MPI-PUGE-AT-0042]|nr:hypothetical protein BKA70DRAFT_1345029 [Coprinopsis sp. MPI-PUGE-AT-0042]